MTFIVLLIALLVERFFDFAHLRDWFWMPKLEALVKKYLKTEAPWAVFAANVVPLVLVVMIVNAILLKTLYGFPGLVFDVVVLLYCFGPRNFWADAFGCINALVTNPSAAVETCRQAFDVDANLDAGERYRGLLDRFFIASESRVFGVVFWYAILGAGGAVLYRFIALLSAREGQEPAKKSVMVLDWLPTRLITMIFALAGNFSKVLVVWPKKAVLGLTKTEDMLIACGNAAMGDDLAAIPDDGKVLRSAVSLLDRTFVISLVLLLVLGLIF